MLPTLPHHLRHTRFSAKLLETGSAAVIAHRLCGTSSAEKIQLNTFSVRLKGGAVEMVALYPKISSLNHSCVANCAMVSSSETARALVYTLYDIPAGTELTIDYFCEVAPTEVRREWLLKSHKFLCQCERCMSRLDPPCITALLNENTSRADRIFEKFALLAVGSPERDVALQVMKKTYAPLHWKLNKWERSLPCLQSYFPPNHPEVGGTPSEILEQLELEM